MEDKVLRELFDTGISKIRQEIKTRLVVHGLYASITSLDTDPTEHGPSGSTIQIIVKGKSVARSFDRAQIEQCHLKVGGAVQSGIMSMVEEVSG